MFIWLMYLTLVLKDKIAAASEMGVALMVFGFFEMVTLDLITLSMIFK